MILLENICGLFPFGDFEYSEGEFKITVSNTTYKLTCEEVFLFKKVYFDFTSDLLRIKEELLKRPEAILPYDEDRGILVNSNVFEEVYKHLFGKKKDDKYWAIYGLMKHCYWLKVVREHEIDEKLINPEEYIRKIYLDKEIEESKKIFFTIVREFHDRTMIFRSPYVNLIDINYLYMEGVYSFFENEMFITSCIPFLFNYFNPKADMITLRLQETFDKKEEIAIEDLFLAKAKVFLRLENFTMAIVHAVIGLDVIVPKFRLSPYNGVNSNEPSALLWYNQVAIPKNQGGKANGSDQSYRRQRTFKRAVYNKRKR